MKRKGGKSADAGGTPEEAEAAELARIEAELKQIERDYDVATANDELHVVGRIRVLILLGVPALLVGLWWLEDRMPGAGDWWSIGWALGLLALLSVGFQFLTWVLAKVWLRWKWGAWISLRRRVDGEAQ